MFFKINDNCLTIIRRLFGQGFDSPHLHINSHLSLTRCVSTVALRGINGGAWFRQQVVDSNRLSVNNKRQCNANVRPCFKSGGLTTFAGERNLRHF